MRKKMFLLFSGLCCCSPLAAADLHLTVTTPGRAPRTLADVPGSIEVVVPEQLKELPGVTLDEKLQALVPGLNTTRSSGDITDRTAALTLRGLGSATQGGRSQGRTLVLLDGVPLNNSATGGVNWNDLTVEEIDRVEVFKGPSSSLYGSNALGGTINIITKPAKGGYSLESSFGTYSTSDTTAKAGVKAGRLSLQVFGKYLESDGYVHAAEADRDAYTRKAFIFENSAGFKAAYDLKGAGEARADLSRQKGITGLGSNYQGTAKGEYRESETDLARLSWKGGRGDLNWAVACFDQRTDQERAEASGPAAHTDIDVARRDRGFLSSVGGNLAGATATLGFDWKHGKVNGYDDYNNGKHARDIGETDSYAPFLQVEKKFLSDKATLIAGLRYDTVRFHDGFSENTNNASLSVGELEEHTWRSFTPKLSAGYRYSDRASQYVSYARGFRAGELEDMVLTLIKGTWYQKPNPDLGPEKADTAETGFMLNPAAGLYLDPSLYLTEAKDFIYQVETGVIAAGKKERIYANVAKVRIYGAEFPVKYIYGEFALSAAYAQSHSRINSAPGLALEGCQLTYAPRHIYSAGLAWKRGGTSVFGSWTHKSRQFTNDANTAASSGYSVMNIGAERKFSEELRASLRLGNLFNERYQQASDELSPGRLITGTLEISF